MGDEKKNEEKLLNNKNDTENDKEQKNTPCDAQMYEPVPGNPKEDDGRVIANMDIDGFRWHRPDGRPRSEKKAENDKERPTFKERMALIFGAYRAFFPQLVMAIVILAVCYFLLRMWMHI